MRNRSRTPQGWPETVRVEEWPADLTSSPLPFHYLFKIALSMQYGNDPEWSGFRAVDDHIIGKFRDRPKAHRQQRYVPPPGSAHGMFSQTAAGGNDLQFNPVSGVQVVLRDKPPYGIEVVRRLRRELKRRTHPVASGGSYRPNCFARRCRNISIAASPSISSPRSA